MRCAILCVAAFAAVTVTAGCSAFRNGWLDLTAVGNFESSTTNEIRASLTLEDTPWGIPGSESPSREDTELIVEEPPIKAGDTLQVEVYELRERQIPYAAQVQVSPTGFVNLPTVGRVEAAGHTVPEFELALTDALRDRNILRDPDVTVSPLFLQSATYSIFGIGVSAAVNAPLRAGTFPIQRPDLRILEAINQVGGLNEFVTEVYVFRTYSSEDDEATPDVTTYENGEADEDLMPGVEGESSLLDDTSAPEADVTPAGADQTADDASGMDGDPAADQSAAAELLRAIDEGDDQTPPQPEDAEPLPEGFEPEIGDAFIYRDGEFVPTRRADRAGSGDAGLPPADVPIPTVNWSRIAGESTYRVLVIPAEHLRRGDPDANIFVRPGDVIRVVSGEIGAYYVMGQVNRPGAFQFNAEPVTLKAAIAVAGGLSPLAWPDRCTVYRRVGAREQMIQIDLDRIFAGKDPDFFIRRADIINVGTHPFAPFLRSIRGLSIPNPVSNVGYSFTYARNFADIDSFSVQQNPANVPDRFPNLFP